MIPFPNKKYQIIYADPPWQFKNYNDDTASNWVGNHYQTQTTEDICKLNIQSITNDNCVLLIWGTWPRLPDCLEVIKRWGFIYKTVGFTWFKTNKNESFFIGMGYWSRSNSEYCLLATKGHPKRIDAGVSQVISFPRMRHSEKPPIVRDKIVELLGGLPRIELFARQRIEGWDAWGDELQEAGVRIKGESA